MEFNMDNERGIGGIADKLFDDDDDSDIVLVNEDGRELAFRQVYATVKDGVVYCILAPAEEVRDLPADGAFVFRLAGGQTLTVVKDAALCSEIFSEYYRCLTEGEG